MTVFEPNGFRRFIAELAAHDVHFVICGGVACVLQGVARVTADLDICVAMDRDNLQRLIAAARALNLQPRIPEPLESLLDEDRRRQWVATKGALVFTLVSNRSPLQLDVFLDYPIPFADLQRQARRMELGDASFLISSREHLVLAKQAVQPPRKVDMRDIEDLQELIRRDPTS